jgi:hypothetical protein
MKEVPNLGTFYFLPSVRISYNNIHKQNTIDTMTIPVPKTKLFSCTE